MTAPTSETPVTQTVAPRRKALNPVVKFALELGPLALFFIVYGRLGIFPATGVLMASVLVTLGVSYAMLKRIPIMPLVTAVIVPSLTRPAASSRAGTARPSTAGRSDRRRRGTGSRADGPSSHNGRSRYFPSPKIAL